MSDTNNLFRTIDFTFTENNFYYQVEYNNKLDETTVTATHIDEFLLWRKVVSSDLLGEVNKMSVTISPKTLFNIFLNYVKDELHKLTQIQFPDGYTSDDESLVINIKTTSPYNEDDTDDKCIVLENVHVSLEEKFQKKLEKRDNKIKEHEEEISNIRKIVDKQLDEQLGKETKIIKKIVKIFDEKLKEKDMENEMLRNDIYIIKKMVETFDEKLKQKDTEIRKLNNELYQCDKEINDIDKSIIMKLTAVESTLTDRLISVENDCDTLFHKK